MFQRMLASALIAGLAAGLLAALLHFAFVQPLILLGEQYETGALVHYGGFGSKPAEHSHEAADLPAADAAASDPGASDPGTSDPATGDASAAAATADAAHAHSAATGDTSPDLKRNALTVLVMVILYAAYGLLLAAGFGMAEAFGHKIGRTQGLLWGVAGFATFQLSPAMGLAPELPGTIAAELSLRQIWWWMTVACTGSGLALLAYSRHWAAGLLGAVFLGLPHLIGAPQMDGFFGVAPTELGAMFSARVLGSSLVVWACLGLVAGLVWAHEARRT